MSESQPIEHSLFDASPWRVGGVLFAVGVVGKATWVYLEGSSLWFLLMGLLLASIAPALITYVWQIDAQGVLVTALGYPVLKANWDEVCQVSSDQNLIVVALVNNKTVMIPVPQSQQPYLLKRLEEAHAV